MEEIRGYDNWKLSEGSEGRSPKLLCEDCEDGFFEGDELFDVDGCYLCESCMKERYRKIL